MRVSHEWLREWLPELPDAETLARDLTMAGLEVSGIEPAAAELDGVVAGRVLAVEPHPDADKLTVCRVDAGQAEELQIVCGADNVYEGMISAVALVGTRVGGHKIRRSKLRGVESQGMLCSARELGLGEDHSGILDLAAELAPGAALGPALGEGDTVIEVELTPNRGDCLSILGVAREVAVQMGQAAGTATTSLAGPDLSPVPASGDERFPVSVADPADCPRFAGRVIRGIRGDARTPLWMAERLRRAGLRPIHPVVDVTNYVMLELGQPMHGYDLGQLSGGIHVRRGRDGETLELLDGRSVAVDPEVLVIADEARVLGLAGIMGGEGTGVTEDSTDIFLESAYFEPRTVAGRARRYGLHTDASHRFERGVDPWLQVRAIERATRLILEIAGGEPGPVDLAGADAALPARPAVSVRHERITRLLGVEVPRADCERILSGLEIELEATDAGWEATPPGHRFDLEREEDFVEEVVRIWGYDRVPEATAAGAIRLRPVPEDRVPLGRLRGALVERGYQEAVTYSFVDPAVQAALEGAGDGAEGYALANPISSELAVMRRSLWPGLLAALRSNRVRQQGRIRLFESGLTFKPQDDDLIQESYIGGVVWGDAAPEQWGVAARPADLFDVKGDVAALVAAGGRTLSARPETHPALHTGQSARLYADDTPLGWLGALHPAHAEALDLPHGVLLFELALGPLQAAGLPRARPVSRFPAIRRDLAVVVPEEALAAALMATVEAAAGGLLSELRLFDLYQGQAVDSGRKSLAFGLILQDSSRTLTDEEADAVISRVADELQRRHEARIRD